MEIETEIQQRNEPILNVGDENMEGSECGEQFLIGASEDEGKDMVFQDDAPEDFYNFDVSVALSEIDSDEINAEFAEAIEDIAGERVFACSQCEKMCKSRGGLTRHT